MDMISNAFAVELSGSAFLGFWILKNDQWLWDSAQSHALGLVGFVIVDLVLAVLVVLRRRWSWIGASFAALVQVAAMLSDLANGQPVGVSSSSFRGYLLSDSSFVALLAIQCAILLMGVETVIARLLHQHLQCIVTCHGK